MNSQKHIFAIYLESLTQVVSSLKIGSNFEFTNQEFHHRITRILRLQAQENLILFDQNFNTQICLDAKTLQSKKTIFGIINQINKNQTLAPEIILCPFLLKKKSFEEVIYFAAQMGANIVQPLLGQKVQIKLNWQKEQERLRKIMIGACEQSKNFVLPKLETPQTLPNFLSGIALDPGLKVFFDPAGQPFFNLLKQVHEEKSIKIFLMFGPEGGLTEEEINLIKSEKFKFYALTPTILRATEAVAVGLGGVRSISGPATSYF